MVDYRDTEEISRLAVANAAMQMSGAEKGQIIFDEIPDPENREYFYAVPEKDAAGKRRDVKFSNEKLEAMLQATETPYLVDWSKVSVRRGLRYSPKFVKIPIELQAYTTEAAKKEWRQWKDDEVRVDAAVMRVSLNLAAGRDISLKSIENRKVGAEPSSGDNALVSRHETKEPQKTVTKRNNGHSR